MNGSKMKNVLIACSIGAMGLLVMCSTPTKQDVRWRTSVDVPVMANKKFVVGKFLDSTFFDSKQKTFHFPVIPVIKATSDTNGDGRPDTVWVDSSVTSDTIVDMELHNAYDTVQKTVGFAFPVEDSAAETISQEIFEDKVFKTSFGVITIPALSSVAASLPLLGPYTAGTPVTTPGIPVRLTQIRSIVFDNTSPPLSVEITNNTNTVMNNVAFAIRSFGSFPVSSIGVGATATVSIPVAGRSIDSTAICSLTVTAASGTAFTAGNNLGLKFILGGCKVQSLTVQDYLLSGYQQKFTNWYKITDTVSVDYIDLEDGDFVYSLKNSSNIRLRVSLTHNHLWSIAFAEPDTVESLAELDAPNGQRLRARSFNGEDSVAFKGNLRLDNNEVDVGENKTFNHLALSRNRLFCVWDTILNTETGRVDTASFSPVDYYISPALPRGDFITMRATDSVVFSVSGQAVSFKKMGGTVMTSYTRASDPTKKPLSLPWDDSVKVELRNNFLLQHVSADIFSTFGLPSGAFMDSLQVRIQLRNPRSQVKVDTVAVYADIRRDTTFGRSINITPLVNDYPDSIEIQATIIIPEGTKVCIVNELEAGNPDYLNYLGRMTIKANVVYNFNADLSWRIIDTVRMDLGGTTFETPGLLDPFKNMTDKKASVNVDVTNNTNLYLKLYGLVGTDSITTSRLTDTANSQYIENRQLSALIDGATLPAGYVRLMGDGLLIPPRDSTAVVSDKIELTDTDLSAMLNSKNNGWRWQVRFLPRYSGNTLVTTPDSLLNTDWIRLNTWLHIDGVNSVDALY